MKGRLGLESARVPHVDRHGLVWLARGRLFVDAGCLGFQTTGVGRLKAGVYKIPYQTVSCVLIGPGSTVSHDAMRLLARHGTGLVAVGHHGVRFYASMPFGPDDSALARRQVRAWNDERGRRIEVIRQMYTWRMGDDLPAYATDLNALRGLEGSRMKETYRVLAQQYGVSWHGRRFDRSDPQSADPPNRALNHTATAVRSAAQIAIASVGAIPQLGFIHEDSGLSFCLDIADLHRSSIAIPTAFAAAREFRENRRGRKLEQIARKRAGEELRKEKVISTMISQVKDLFPK